MVSLIALLLATCDSLWTEFREPNPINCLLNPGICEEGQVCNSQTRLCRVPTLTLVAGEIGGPGNADDTGADARFNGLYGVAADGTGNLYVADTYNHTIRKVVLSTGAVTTIAGMAGMSGPTDGTGAAARFYQPLGLAVDGAGNLYVADTYNHTIRKVVLSTGAVTTIAGTAGMNGSTDGMGTAARFLLPYGVASDGAGNLYVADTYNHTIRKVVLSTGAVTTIVGTAGMPGSADGTGAAARFNYPSAVVPHGADTLYVADTNNSTIRKVVLSTGAVTTIAGTAGMNGSTDGMGTAAQFGTPDGVATDGAGNLYVADGFHHTIRKVVLSTGTVTTIAGTAGIPGSVDGTGATAQFRRPFGVATDGTGNLYVADHSNNVIRKVVLSTGAVTTIAGTPAMAGSSDGTGRAAKFLDPFTMAVDGAGNLFVGDHTNHMIRKVVVSTGVVTTLAGTAGMVGSADGTGAAARFYFPYGIATDGTDNLYVSDSNNHTIRKVVVSTGAVTTLAGTAGMMGSVDGTGATARLFYPSGLAVDGVGNLYVSDGYNHTIRKVVTSTGDVTTLAGTAGLSGSADGTGAAARFYYPYGVAIDGAGNYLYVVDRSNHTIRRVETSTGAVTTIAGTAGMIGRADGTGAEARFNFPNGVATDGAGNLYVADRDNHTIRKIELANSVVTTIAGIAGQGGVKLGILPGRINFPIGVAVLPTREILFSGENAILAIR